VITDSLWRGAEMGIGVPTRGSVTTVYDERDLPIEMQILDNKGRIVTQCVRTYDSIILSALGGGVRGFGGSE